MSKEVKIVWKYTPKEAQDRLHRIIDLNVKHKDAQWMIEQIQRAWTRVDLLSASLVEVERKHVKHLKRKDDIK